MQIAKVTFPSYSKVDFGKKKVKQPKLCSGYSEEILLKESVNSLYDVKHSLVDMEYEDDIVNRSTLRDNIERKVDKVVENLNTLRGADI